MRQEESVVAQSREVAVAGTRFIASFQRRSSVGVLALHGTIEEGTAELAHAIADRSGASVLAFTQPWRPATHVPSHQMGSDDCDLMQAFLAHCRIVVSLHGHGRGSRPAPIYLGGANRAAANLLGRRLEDLGDRFDVVDQLEDIPQELRGLHPLNPVNLAQCGGVQVELPPAARERPPAPAASALFGDLVAAISDGILDFELASRR